MDFYKFNSLKSVHKDGLATGKQNHTWAQTTCPPYSAGKPVIKGTRISVELILERLADDWSMDDILSAYPHLTKGDDIAAIKFSAAVKRGHKQRAHPTPLPNASNHRLC